LQKGRCTAAVGSGKTFSMAAAVMEERRLGLVRKALLVVPGHCLAQASREFLQLYLKLPSIKGGRRQLITADASDAFHD
jgi:N12 class adenine-specific DNA methylase